MLSLTVQQGGKEHMALVSAGSIAPGGIFGNVLNDFLLRYAMLHVNISSPG